MRRFYFLPLLLISLAASAADIDAPSKIISVSLFPQSAVITRVADVELRAGSATVVFTNLPIGLDPASIELSGQGSRALIIGAVTAYRVKPEPKPETEMDGQLKDLQKLRASVQVDLDALSAKRAMIIKFSTTGPEKIGPEAKPLDVGDWAKAWNDIQSGLRSVGKEVDVLQAKAHELDESIAGIKAALPRLNPPPQPGFELSVDVESAQAQKARLSLNYSISGASWHPLYDVRLSTGDLKHPEIVFTRKASVSQSSGEDWTGVELSVSTLRVERGVSLPEVSSQLVRFREYMPVEPLGPRLKSNAPGRAANSVAQMDEKALEPGQVPIDASVKQSAIESDNFSATFKIPGRTTVLSDGGVETFQISSRNLTPELSFVSFPPVDSRAFIQAHIVNEKDVPLLPGQVAIYRDGSYLGTGHLDFTPANDAFDLSFGADEKIKISRNPVKIKENDPWFGLAKSLTRSFSTIIENLHETPVKLTLLDVLPVSGNTAITVEQLPDTVVAQQKAVSDKPGVISWSYSFEPRERREIRFGYRVKWPSDRDIIVQPLQAWK